MKTLSHISTQSFTQTPTSYIAISFIFLYSTLSVYNLESAPVRFAKPQAQNEQQMVATRWAKFVDYMLTTTETPSFAISQTSPTNPGFTLSDITYADATGSTILDYAATAQNNSTQWTALIQQNNGKNGDSHWLNFKNYMLAGNTPNFT